MERLLRRSNVFAYALKNDGTNIISTFIIPRRRVFPTRSVTTGPWRAGSFLASPPAARRLYESAPLSSSKNSKPSKPTNNNNNARTPSITRRPTNRQIPFDHVFVLDPDTKKLSEEKRTLESLLLETQQPLEKKRGCIVELVASTPEPIVRVTTRGEVEARYREMRRALKRGSRVGEEPKEIQLTWGVGRADLEHKLRKAGRELEKGYRVVVVVTVRYGNRPSSRREWVAFGDEIAEALGEVGEEWKEREVTDRTMTLSFQRVPDNDDP